MVQDKLGDGQKVVYMVDDVPATIDKPRFNFSKVSYKQSREMNNLQTRIQQKTSELLAALKADDLEDLVDQLEALKKELESNFSAPARDYKLLQVRIKRLEDRIDRWVEVDINAIRDEHNALLDQQETHLLAGVEYVPQSWLIEGAPLAAGIDWSDHTSLRWLRGDKLQPLAKAKGEAQNSPN